MNASSASRHPGDPRAAALSSGAFWAVPEEELLAGLGTSTRGLSSGEAADRLATAGPNQLRPPARGGDLGALLRQFSNPIVLILIGATLVSFVLRDVVDGLIILAIVLASGGLGFWQERAATRAVAALLARVAVEVEVRRDGETRSLPIEQVVPGEIVVLNAGDVIPADGRVLAAQALQVDEATLTGEAYPVEKGTGTVPAETPLAERANALFMGSHVLSGEGIAVIVQTGARTELGGIAAALGERDVTTGFERGITAFGLLLARATALLVVAIFAVNLVLNRPFVESLLFSLALAVGLTPQLLPAIVSVSLATGARQMARQQVIVKRLDAIEDFGGLTTLCTDKTGTLTEGSVSLAAALDPAGAPSERVRRLAWLNAHCQQGYANPLDNAILGAVAAPEGAPRCLGEAPYDFARKRLSVLTREQETDGPRLVTKGALERVLAVSTAVATAEGPIALDQARRSEVHRRFEALSAEGFRVLGVATRALPGATGCTAADEHDLTFEGMLAFSDPPKAGAAAAVVELTTLGISVRMITGDNPLAARHAGAAVGLDCARVLTGPEVAALSDAELATAAAEVAIFAEIEPVQKERIVAAFRAAGQVVGFLGDGVNDAPALHAADVGISIDTAVDVAKQAAPIVLLDKDLAVVADGVRLGRRTFANTLKYINVTTSANFGNMLSMAAAAAFLPFLPLLPRQILLLNFLSDIPGTTIARDRVDEEQLARPQAWQIDAIRTFMIVFGSISTCFDLATFAILRLGFDAGPGLFRSGWFVESTLTELAVMLVLRTRRSAFRSRPGRMLLISSALVAVVTVALPFSPLAGALGLRPLPVGVLAALAGITALYVLVTEVAKLIVYRPAPTAETAS